MSPHVCLCSAFQPRLQQVSQMLHFYSSVSQKRPQSAAVSHYTRLSGSAPVFLSPCHLPFASENQQGNASNHLSCKHTAACILPLLHKEKNLCKCLAKQGTRQACTSPFTGNIDAAKFSSKKKMWLLFLFVSPVCASFYPLSPSFLSVPLQRTHWRDSVVHCCQKCVSCFFFFSYSSSSISQVFCYLFPVRFPSLKCHVRCLRVFFCFFSYFVQARATKCQTKLILSLSLTLFVLTWVTAVVQSDSSHLN